MSVRPEKANVEVVIPTYGRSAMLQAAVDSALTQSHPNTFVVVIDDCSPEPPCLRPDSRLRIIRQTENRGPGAARNRGVASSHADYIVFCDDDDLMDRHRVASSLAKAGPGRIVLCGRQYLQPDGVLRPASAQLYDGDMSRTLMVGDVPHLGQALLPRSDFVNFDEKMRSAEDWDWWLRISSSLHFVSTAEHGYTQRLHEGDRHGRGPLIHLANRKQLLVRNLAYFEQNRLAHAIALQRIGQAALKAGRPAEACRYFAKSLAKRPRLTAAKMSVVALREVLSIR